MEWLAAAVSAFVVIVPVELPDKTFVATLVLCTRYRPLPVWAGAVAAFGVQCAVAAGAGRAVALLPERPVRVAAAVLFAVGGLLLVRGARSSVRAEAEQEQELAAKVGRFGGTARRREGWAAFGASFLTLFVAEWGDLSQLLTAGLVASGRPPVPVFAGSWLGLASVAGLGVLLGRVILRHIRLAVVRYIGAGVCFVLSLTIAYQVIQGEWGHM